MDWLPKFGRWLVAIAIFMILFAIGLQGLSAQVRVRGYYRKDGTYVQPHTRTSPDGNPYNNYSFPGNYNPNTGMITPGNPETYLRRYYSMRSNGPTGGATDWGTIIALQQSLKMLGHYPGTINGIYGFLTATAVRNFQQARNLPVTGEPTPETVEEIIRALDRLKIETPDLTIPPIELPANAHLDIYGSGWDCNRGFARYGSACVAVQIPANAHLDIYGSGWDCNRGFAHSGTGCVAVGVPANAHLDIYGSGWDCNRGFARYGSGCVAVQVPANAHLDIYGSGWDCNRGFAHSGTGCVAVGVPANAHLDIYGSGWDCNRGFARYGSGCVAVQVPANAHLDIYGSGWDCNRGFAHSGTG